MSPPVDDILPRSFPKIKPEDGTGDYLLSKLEKQCEKKFPDWDVASDSVKMSLILAKRDLYNSEQRLINKRKTSVEKSEHLNKQWQELREKEQNLQESFKKFDQFIKENQQKRERAKNKIMNEKNVKLERQNEIEIMKKDIAYLLEIKEKMDKKIKEYRMFEDYLQAVINSTPFFKAITDILVRFEALVGAKDYLHGKQEGALFELENAKTEMRKSIMDKLLTVMGLNNQVTELQTKYNTAKTNALLWEILVGKIQEISLQKNADIKLVRSSCYDMYKQICIRKNIVPTLASDDFEGHLLFIKKTLLELGKICQIATEKQAHEINSLKLEVHSSK